MQVGGEGVKGRGQGEGAGTGRFRVWRQQATESEERVRGVGGRSGGLGESKKLGSVSVVQVRSPTIISIKI